MSVNEQPTLNRAQRRKQRTYERLLNATDHILHTEGYTTLTVRKITDYADMGHGTFYLHFDNVDGAVWAVLERNANITNEAMVTQLASEPPRRRAYLSWIYMFEFVRETSELFLQMFGKEGSAELIQAYQNWLAQSHEMNMEAGAYQPHAGPPIYFQAQYMAGATLRTLCWWAENGFEHTPEEMATMLYEMTYQTPVPDA
ncbi:MAG: TetR/AcrR family transcriptional regulator [Chloroflexota bacterium]